MKKYLLLSFLLLAVVANAQHAYFRGTNNYVAPVVAPPTPSNALDFDGVDDYVENTTLVINPSLGFTIEGWMKVNDFGYSAMATQTINNYPAPFDMYVTNGSGNVSFLVGQGSVTGSVTSSSTLTIGTWAHLAFVYNPSIAKIQIYINGILDGISDATLPGNVAGSKFIIGNRYDNYTGLNGTLDDVRIWNLPRTQSEIQSNMNRELAGTETGLVAYYPFNQGIAAGNNTAISNAIDKTPNARNGVLYNFAKTGTTSNFVIGKVANVISVPRVISNGLQLHYDASDPTSYPGTGSTWYDLSGNNRNGTLVNNSGFNSTVAGGVLTFNGTNQYINTTYIPSPTCTISIWFYNNLNYSDWNRGIFSTFALGNYNGFYMGTSSVGSFNPSLNIWYNGNSALYSISSVMTINRWYNITVTSGSGTISIYLNGVLKNTISGSTNHADVLNIGRTRFDNNYWSGYIGNTMVYDRVLSAAEVTQNFDTLKTRFGL